MVYKILLLGHSFISHFKRFVKNNQTHFTYSLNLDPREVMVQYSSLPGATVTAISNKKRYDSELPYQRPDLIEVMEIEIDLTTSTNVHTNFYISVREFLDC